MQSPQDISIHPTPVSPAPGAANSVASTGAALGDYRIIRRNGAVVAFEPSKIAIAMTKTQEHCATMSSKGQVVVPSDVRKRLGLVQGSVLRFVLEADGVTDFSGYAAIPGTPDDALFPDIFLD